MRGEISMTTTSREKSAARPSGRTTVVLVLLACGVFSALLYAALLVFIPMLWPDYSSASQTVSELSAVDAPTRSVWVPLALIWTVLYAGFGVGVWLSAGPSRRLRLAGVAIIVAAGIGLFWPPMHQRAVLAAGNGTLTDTLHIVWTVANGTLTLFAMGFAATPFGKRFCVYSISTMGVLLAAGALTSIDAPRVQANLPTPWIGVWERVNMAAWLLWVVALAVTLLRQPARGAAR
jgi:hypothetical protein